MRTARNVIARNEAISKPCQSKYGHGLKCGAALLIALFCLVFANDTIAQNDNARKDTSQKPFKIVDARDPSNTKPLVILNDKEFKGNLKSLDPNNIESITVIKSPDKLVAYGPKGANGVLVIKTKDYVTPVKPDSRQASDKVLYVVDGVPVQKSQADTADVLIRKSMSQKEMLDKGISFEKNLDSLVLIITRAGAIQAYQKKFSSLNKEYGQFVKKEGDDRMCNYFIDDKGLDKDDKDFITRLYEIPADKIQSITVYSPRPMDSFIGLNVRIVTKK